MSVSKILFVHIGRFSKVNTLIREKLTLHFPNTVICDLDVYDILWQHKRILLLNTYYFVKEYGRDFLLGKKKIKEGKRFFISTPYVFDFLKRYFKRKISADDYLFSFQTQSLFDLSIEGIPHFIYTDHTNLCNYFYPTLSLSPSRLIKTDLYHARERTIYLNARKIFVMGKHTKSSLIHQYGIAPEKVIKVGCGGNIEIPAYVEERKYHNKNILFVGDRWELKGGKVLVEAFKIVKKYHPDATLTMVGSNTLVNVKGCTVVKRVPLETLQSFYDSATVFCMPSIVETFGVVFVEAMYYRLPIVTSNVGSNKLTIKHGVSGIITDGSVYQIANALAELIGDADKCRKYGQAGYELALKKYTWEVVFSKIYRTIAEEIRVKQLTE